MIAIAAVAVLGMTPQSVSSPHSVRWDGGFNPFLPLHEYIPDAEPRVFGNRLYLYGSHDRAGSRKFCDTILRVWSAPLNDLTKWRDHGIVFSTKAEGAAGDDVPWTDNDLYAPDVVEKDGKYYLFAYIVGAPMAVAVSDKPSGPFKVKSQIKAPPGAPNDFGGWGQYIDPGVLVDNDGKVHLYWGFQRSHYAQLDPKTMTDIVPGTYRPDIIPKAAPFNYFEACSPRRIGNRYYLVYADGGLLVYATSDRPEGPFKYGGTIITNGRDYPGGNIHGGLVNLHGQWFVTYHRMTNGTIFSRRTCIERIEILPDGSIPQVQMTSMGFSRGLDPYQKTPADVACILTGGNMVTEFDPRTQAVVRNRVGSVLGYRTFVFPAKPPTRMELEYRPRGTEGTFEVWLGHPDKGGKKIGAMDIAAASREEWQTMMLAVDPESGRHDLFFRFQGKDGSGRGEIAQLRSFRFLP
jgi:hypothetical protein